MANNNSNSNTPFMILGIMLGMFVIPNMMKSCAKNNYEKKLTKAGYYYYEKQWDACQASWDSLYKINEVHEKEFDRALNTKNSIDADGNDSPELQKVNKRGQEIQDQFSVIEKKRDFASNKMDKILDSLQHTKTN